VVHEVKFTIASREIEIGGPEPELRPGEKLVRRTASLCPECYRILPAIVLERDGAIWIRRVCPKHGEIEEIYWSDAELYHRAMEWEIKGLGIDNPQVDLKYPCPFNCGLCSLHTTCTALANIVVTNRCDLSCWYCFFYAEKAGFVYEPTLEQIEYMLKVARDLRPIPVPAIQLTGGEPTLRDDLVEIVRIAKRLGVRHVQLNTNGIRLAFDLDYLRKLRSEGVNTLYLSFDGVTPETNPKNHWEIPYLFENCRAARMTSVVLVPTVIKGYNDHELGAILKFAAMNIDIVRGVNYQPVSLTGRMPRHEREKFRITIPDVIRKIEEQTEGQIAREDWYPTPSVVPLARFLSLISGKWYIEFTNHPACGMATYVYVEKRGEKLEDTKMIPITRFIDAEGFLEYLREKIPEVYEAGKFTKYIKAIDALLKLLTKFIDVNKVPKDLNLRKILTKIFIKRNYKALGEFHYKLLFIGMMHFMDLYNYDIDRVRRCCIHYLVPDGRIIPFCTFNVLSDIYRDYIQEKYKVPLDEWVKIKGSHTVGPAIKYRRNVEKLVRGEAYRKHYEEILKLVKR